MYNQIREQLLSDYYLKKNLSNIKTRKTSLYNGNKSSNLMLSDRSMSSNKTYKKEHLLSTKIISLKGTNMSSIHGLERIRRDKSIEINKTNVKFNDRLKRVSSPLSREIMNSSFMKHKDYGNIAKKIKSLDEINKIRNRVKMLSLPPIINHCYYKK